MTFMSGVLIVLISFCRKTCLSRTFIEVLYCLYSAISKNYIFCGIIFDFHSAFFNIFHFCGIKTLFSLPYYGALEEFGMRDNHFEEDEQNGQFPEGMFRFEKRIER